MELPEDVRRLLVDAGRPTPLYQAYLVHRERYEAEVRRRDEARAAASHDPRALQAWPMTARSYRERIDAALQRWQVLGSKARVEAAIARLGEEPDVGRPTADDR